MAALATVARARIASELVLGGGAALAAVYLHHRVSEDLDFFAMREVEATELRPLARSLAKEGVTVTQEQVGVRRSLILSREASAFGRIDFAYYPYDPIDRCISWSGLCVESLTDMAVNKVQAVLTRFQPRDFVDLYFLLREGAERDVGRLLDFARAKFDVGTDSLGLARRLLLVHDILELPRMLRPVTTAQLVSFLEDQARALVRGG